jgi:hypothetical protein
MRTGEVSNFLVKNVSRERRVVVAIWDVLGAKQNRRPHADERRRCATKDSIVLTAVVGFKTVDFVEEVGSHRDIY